MRTIRKKQQPPKGPLPHITQVMNGGKELHLSDGTIWEIRPEDVIISGSWLFPSDIAISSSGDAKYPHRLTNRITGTYVLAKKQ